MAHDYSVAFSDSQELQLSRERLLKALSVIESSIESITGIQEHLNDLQERGALLHKNHVQIELNLYQSRMRGHKRAFLRLLEVSQGISNLVCYHFTLGFTFSVAMMLTSGVASEDSRLSQRRNRTEQRRKHLFYSPSSREGD